MANVNCLPTPSVSYFICQNYNRGFSSILSTGFLLGFGGLLDVEKVGYTKLVIHGFVGLAAPNWMALNNRLDLLSICNLFKRPAIDEACTTKTITKPLGDLPEFA